MQAGKLRNTVTIQQQTAGQDEIGQPMTTWTNVATVWADIRHLSGIETVKAGAQISAVKASIRIRYRAGINAGMRILHGSTIYNIAAVMPDAAKTAYVDLVCEIVT